MSAFIDYLNAEVNKAIYVWGGQGENLSDKTPPEAEKWIRSKETSTYNANRAITTYRKRLAEGVSPIHAYDCSGLIMYFVFNLHHITDSDLTAQGIYNKCNYHPTAQELRAGDFVFRGKTAGEIKHVGVYVGGGKVIEAKGRDDGVVKTDIFDGGWGYYGHLDGLDPYLAEPEYPKFSTVTSPMSTGSKYKAMQKALNAAGFTDYNNKPLDEDGKWGKKSRSAFEKMINYYTGG